MSRVVHRSVFLRRARLDMTTGRVVYALGALDGVVSELDARVTCAEGVWACLRITHKAAAAGAAKPAPRQNVVFRCAPVEPGVCAGRALGRPGLDLRGCDAVLVLNLRRPRADAPFLVPAAELEYTLTCDGGQAPPSDARPVNDAFDDAACLDVD